MNIYFTSDLHFGHEYILRACERPYADLFEMERDLIERWNARVKGCDKVFILGDMFYRTDNIIPVLERLKGKKYLIEGNHDESWINRIGRGVALRYFEEISPMMSFSDGERGLTLCHYPLLTYKHQRTTFMIHGHLHLDTSSDFWELLVSRDRVLNAGVDINGFSPVTFEELTENNRRHKIENPTRGENRRFGGRDEDC